MKKLVCWKVHEIRVTQNVIGKPTTSVQLPLFKFAMAFVTEEETQLITQQLTVKGSAILRGEPVMMTTFAQQ